MKTKLSTDELADLGLSMVLMSSQDPKESVKDIFADVINNDRFITKSQLIKLCNLSMSVKTKQAHKELTFFIDRSLRNF